MKASRLCAPDGENATERDKDPDRLDSTGDSVDECEVGSDTYVLSDVRAESVNKQVR